MRTRYLALALAIVALWGAGCSPPAAAPAAPAKPAASAAQPPQSALAAPAAAPTAAPADEVRVGLIAPLATYWAIYAADALGYFTREGIKYEQMYTRSPAQSAQLLVSGDLDIASNTADTAIIAMSKGADFALVAGTQSEALFTLIAVPGVQSVPELRGKGIAINNSTRDGIATMLRRTLRHHGLREDEVDLLMVGGTPERYTAVKSGAAAAAILTQPQDIMAVGEGLNRLALVADVVGDWQNLAVIVHRPWARANEDRLVRWLRAYIAACAWLPDPANRAEAVKILASATQSSEDLAQRIWALYYEERAGRAMPADGGLNLAGVRNVIAAIEDSGNFDGAPAPALERVVDQSYWERARR